MDSIQRGFPIEASEEIVRKQSLGDHDFTGSSRTRVSHPGVEHLDVLIASQMGRRDVLVLGMRAQAEPGDLLGEFVGCNGIIILRWRHGGNLEVERLWDQVIK